MKFNMVGMAVERIRPSNSSGGENFLLGNDATNLDQDEILPSMSNSDSVDTSDSIVAASEAAASSRSDDDDVIVPASSVFDSSSSLFSIDNNSRERCLTLELV